MFYHVLLNMTFCAILSGVGGHLLYFLHDDMGLYFTRPDTNRKHVPSPLWEKVYLLQRLQN